ncbi:MAG: fibronectin type III domain-containing protein [Gemmatimonadaceae bacterium]
MQRWIPRLIAASMFAAGMATTAAAQQQERASGDAKLAAPAKLWAARTSPTEITLVWQPVKGATAYEIHERQPDGSSVEIMSLAGGQIGRVVIPIGRLVARQVAAEAERVTRLFLRAVNGPKASTPAWFNEVFVGPGKGLVRPTTPANLRAEETSPGVITVTWDEVRGATAYTIGRAAGNDGFRRHCELCPTGGRFVDTVPATGVRYVYSVVAIGPGGASVRATTPAVVPGGAAHASGAGGAANPKEATPAADSLPSSSTPEGKDAAPGAPTQLKAALLVDDKGRRGVRLSWRAGAGTVTYEVLRAACNGPLQVIARLEPPPFELGVFPAMQYFDAVFDAAFRQGCALRYELKGINPKGAVAARFDDVPVTTPGGGAPSSPAAAPPPPPANPQARAVSGNEVRLTWTASPGATGYRIERAIGASTYQLLATLSAEATSYADARTGLMKQNPKYRISALNAAGASAAVSFP